jgi:uncharacterized protein (DUF433 family)
MGYQERISAFPPVTITSKPEIMGGTPCVDGTRVPAETIVACINAGMSEAEILSHYTWLPMRAIDAVAKWAQDNDYPLSLPVRRMP